MQRTDLIAYLDQYLKIGSYQDRSNNGLQVQGNDNVTRVAFAVDACLAAFKAAVAGRAQLLIVHHGLFWSEHIQITGMHYERVKTLICAGCGLYGAHIPLDAHPEVGNNIQLARMAGLQNIQPWGNHHSDVIGFIGDLPQPLPVAELNARLETQIGAGNRLQPGDTALCRRVAVLSGFGVDFAGQAVAAGADTLITGETSHTWYHPVAEQNLNVIYGGHYNTETVGLKALACQLASQFGLETAFTDLPTGL
ncbi:MAG: Nif3-like dinuclear metal center hexameric protein [Chloroflexi bacterium]|nr:Nif3-like dinuclear metal center hexameric protein [Chloroflexota bacterium]